MKGRLNRNVANSEVATSIFEEQDAVIVPLTCTKRGKKASTKMRMSLWENVIILTLKPEYGTNLSFNLNTKYGNEFSGRHL